MTAGGDLGHEGQPVGSRVVVRSLVRGELGPSGGPAMTDVVGVLEVVEERQIVVRRRDGTTSRVDRADIVALKVVPPSPPRRPRSGT